MEIIIKLARPVVHTAFCQFSPLFSTVLAKITYAMVEKANPAMTKSSLWPSLGSFSSFMRQSATVLKSAGFSELPPSGLLTTCSAYYELGKVVTPRDPKDPVHPKLYTVFTECSTLWCSKK
jgi:hypothetical protein